jgi:NAD(P)-dependent dehydrogenase (short-subunit alcohol dehydrogenase family)
MTAIYSELEGRVVLVTGGGQGIGEATVRAFARQKAKVAFLDIAEEASRALESELSADGGAVTFEPCDLADIPALRRAIEKVGAALGPVQVLVNNAANDGRHATEEVTEAYWDERMALNLKHQFFAAQAVLPGMKAAGAGAIVNLGSTSWMAGQGGMAAYTACKSAVIGLTRSLARDFGPFGVRVNAVAPGWIMTRRQLEQWVTPETEAELYQRQCLKRMLQPAEVAEFVVFLASDAASACTNQHYVVDGGWT